MIELSEGMVGKILTVVCQNGKTISGKCVSYIPAKDNEPEIDSIWIEQQKNIAEELFRTEIVSIN